LHPGGRAVLVDSAVAGQDATEAFYGLHRHEVLERPQYARLRVGVLRGEKSVVVGRVVGGLSEVPYAEPTYLSKGFHSPYYSEVRAATVLLTACAARTAAWCWVGWCDASRTVARGVSSLFEAFFGALAYREVSCGGIY